MPPDATPAQGKSGCPISENQKKLASKMSLFEFIFISTLPLLCFLPLLLSPSLYSYFCLSLLLSPLTASHPSIIPPSLPLSPSLSFLLSLHFSLLLFPSLFLSHSLSLSLTSPSLSISLSPFISFFSLSLLVSLHSSLHIPPPP